MRQAADAGTSAPHPHPSPLPPASPAPPRPPHPQHAPGTPIDWISYHFYAGASQRNDSAAYTQFFADADGFVTEVAQIVAIRDALNPGVKMDVDETGVILPDDNDPKWTSDAPGFPLVYWNAAAAGFTYVWARLGMLGVDVVGESQLVGYPELPAQGLAPQYPSVALLNWTDGSGTARYWVIKLLIDLAEQGSGLLNTTAGAPAANPFCGSITNLQDLSLACTDAGATIDNIVFASYGTPTGTCGNYAVGACNAANSTAIVQSYCVGKNSCTVPATTPIFGDPCYDTVKELVVEAHCTTGGGVQPGTAGPVFAQAYSGAARRVLVINKTPDPQGVTLAGATGAAWAYVDESTGFGPYAETTLSADTWTLAPYAVGFVTLA